MQLVAFRPISVFHGIEEKVEKEFAKPVQFLTSIEMYRSSYIHSFKFDTMILFCLSINTTWTRNFYRKFKIDSVKCFEEDVEGKVII